MDDQQLLDAYARERSDDALKCLIDRHVNLVYSAAVRQLKDPHLSEDVTQTTFIALARHARRLTGERVLSAWLLVTTRNAALDAIKARARRRRHEREAAQMATTIHNPNDDASKWDDVAPHLDEALASLSADDRRAVTLRYFEGCSPGQVAERLGISLDAARQRVHRATTRMHGYFTRKGVDISAAALGPLISVHAVHSAPPALALVTAKVLSGAVHGTIAVTAAKGSTVVGTTLSMKALLVGVTAIVLIGGSAVTVRHLARPKRSLIPVALVEQQPAAAPAIAAESSTVIGYVFTPDGKPAVGAQVAASTKHHYVAIWQGSTYSNGKPVPPFIGVGIITVDDYLHYDYLDGQHVMPSREITGWQGVTGSDGRFELHLNQRAAGVFVGNKFGGAVAAVADLSQNPRITLQQWARVEGDVYVGKMCAPKATVTTENMANPQMVNRANIVVQAGALSDNTGHFVIPEALPGATMIFRPISMGPENKGFTRHGDEVDFAVYPPWHGNPHVVQIPVGGTARVSVGGTGRAVIGHVTHDVNNSPFRRVRITPRPANGPNRPIPYAIAVDITSDGSFRIDDLPAGAYHIRVETGQMTERSVLPPKYRFLDLTATADKDFEIPAMTTARMDEPLDLGAFDLTPLPHLETGKPVPDLIFQTHDQTTPSLAAFKGKFVLLEIGAGAIIPSHRDTDHLIAIHDRLLTDPRFTILSVDSDAKPEKTFEPDSSPWQHATVHEFPQEYLNSGSTLYVIDPEGKLLASNFDAFAAYDFLDKTLAPQTGAMHITVDRVPRGSVDANSPYTRVQAPNLDNVARTSTIRIVDGKRAENSGPPDRLVDGRMPSTEDAPTQNFKFADFTLEGRISFDLGRSVPISAINSYSWHKDKRAPQVYHVYGSDGAATDFDTAPRNGTDPVAHGWKLIATVDTRANNTSPGGRYAVSIANPGATLGTYRYLLFVMFPARADDVSGHTFYSEINVIERK